jgi:hypothetical protein
VVLDRVLGFMRVTASTISDATKGILLNLDPGQSEKDPDRWDEYGLKQPLMTALGIIARPRRPSKLSASSQEQRSAETLVAKLGDRLLALAFRDLRLNALFPNPKEGSINLVGYGGAFDSNEATFDGNEQPKSSTRTIYVPYAFQNGAPTKAHAIVIDGTQGNESISIIHGDGMAVLMKHGGKNSVTVKNKAGDAYVEVNDEGVTLNGNTVVNGGAVLGGPVGAQAVAIAPPLVTYLSALEILLGTIAAATVPTTAPAVAAFVTAQAATKVAMAAQKAVAQ